MATTWQPDTGPAALNRPPNIMKKALLPGQLGQITVQPDQMNTSGSLTPFGPGKNLIGTQIGPGGSLGQQTTNQAAQTVGGAQLRDPSQPLLNLAQQNIGQAQVGQVGGYGADVGQARQTTGQLLGSLANAPSRQDLALQSYDALANADLANRGAAIRGLGQRAAALGRIGSGERNQRRCPESSPSAGSATGGDSGPTHGSARPTPAGARGPL